MQQQAVLASGGGVGAGARHVAPFHSIAVVSFVLLLMLFNSNLDSDAMTACVSITVLGVGAGCNP